MGQDVFLSLMNQALMTVLLLSAPALAVAIVVGLSVG
ncbi:flagellar biosynthetic protein FliQ, partial [Pseudomonas viridiflava]